MCTFDLTTCTCSTRWQTLNTPCAPGQNLRNCRELLQQEAKQGKRTITDQIPELQRERCPMCEPKLRVDAVAKKEAGKERRIESLSRYTWRVVEDEKNEKCVVM